MSSPFLLILSLLSYTDSTRWLLGTWVNLTPRGAVYESWTRQADGSLAGKSYAIKGADTLVLETVQLIREKDVLLYIPTVPNQNQGQPVRFTATKVSAEQLVFENAAHDFPLRISYTRIHQDSLVAEIAGMRNGQLRKQTFPMKRVK
jgi:hypothetical protein